MRVISVISQKGGAGKTTIAVHIAVAAMVAGVRTAVIDLDPQTSARRWGDKRDRDPEVISDHAERLSQLLAAAGQNGADLVVIDTAPNADRATLIAARAAELILIPCRPAAFDLDAIEATRELADIARKVPYIVLSAAPVRSNLVGEARQGLTAKGALVAPVVLHNRVAFSHAVIDGRTATEYEPGGKAAQEAIALTARACRHVGLQANLHDAFTPASGEPVHV